MIGNVAVAVVSKNINFDWLKDINGQLYELTNRENCNGFTCYFVVYYDLKFEQK